MAEVRITDEAIETMNSMLRIIDGGFQDSIADMIRLGNDLGAGDMWRGGHADEFASLWEDYSTQLNAMKDSLDEMNATIQRVGEEITIAGGDRS